MNKTYPAVQLVARHGRNLAIFVGALIAIAAVAALLFGAGASIVAAGFIAAVATWGFLRLLAEIVEVVAETLLPR
jgi:hypothetical protein